MAIAVGGAIGAVARHYASGQVMRLVGMGFPFGTLLVNVVGSFAMGALVEVMALRWDVGPELRGFLTVGVLGAFTTFSAFSLDFVVLTERGQLGLAVLYAVVSVALSVAGLFAGMHVVRGILV
jgi:CrcB protein